MDAPEEKDIKLQRKSADLITDFETSLPRLLWSTTDELGSAKRLRRIRPRVQQRETTRLIGLVRSIASTSVEKLEPFQEWPQLLDPHLANFVPPLVAAFIESLRAGPTRPPLKVVLRASSVISLPCAICKLIYTLCKIRGEKVISRFFNNEPRYLEPMLSAFETHATMTWEERYIMLLWISHLLLAPFDLESLSSPMEDANVPDAIPGLHLPANLPSLACRVIPLAVKYLAAPSKERDAARALLVRLGLRPDMRRLGLLDRFLAWATEAFMSPDEAASSKTIYEHIGMLSFIAGVLVSADHDASAPFTASIYYTAQKIIHDEAPFYEGIRSSALTRKLLIKVVRAVAIETLQSQPTGPNALSAEARAGILEEAIDYLLASLADKDTPVRYAASKALSLITAQLDEDMAAELVDAVVGSLAEDVLWLDESTGRQYAPGDSSRPAGLKLEQDLNAVNPLRWHGLTLTLAHLLFRRSPPAHQLPAILHALILALQFEQRSSTGGSIGTNIRDAACFGIWSLSRRYTSDELAHVSTSTITSAPRRTRSVSIQQLLACELTAAACLDPVGNIRRGASAALQELIGRHPDTVRAGIALVQVVDYHAVALRGRAIAEVAVHASQLDETYWHTLFDAILDWRGLGSSDAESRRTAAGGIGFLSAVVSAGHSRSSVVSLMVAKISDVRTRRSFRQVEDRHGLLLALSAILESVAGSEVRDGVSSMTGTEQQLITVSLDILNALPDKDLTSSSVHAEWTAEAVCRLVSATAEIIALRRARSETDRGYLAADLVDALVSRSVELLSLSLARNEDGIINASSMAAKKLLAVLDRPQKERLVQLWVSNTTGDAKGRGVNAGRGFGYLNALGAVLVDLSSDGGDELGHLSPQQQLIINALVSFARSEAAVESRVMAMRNLAKGFMIFKVLPGDIVAALTTCLDDYTIDSRGDVGSWVRVEAIGAVAIASRAGLLDGDQDEDPSPRTAILSRVARLAAEKLDKVRFRAWLCLREVLGKAGVHARPPEFSDTSRTSTYPYFRYLLSLVPTHEFLEVSVLEGIVTSAGVGSEPVLRASRAALACFADDRADQARFSVYDLGKVMTQVIRQNLHADRVLVPALETLAFLLECGVLQSLDDARFKWRPLLALVQQAHYKSGSVGKLEAAVKVYTGFADIASVREAALTKLVSMLLHPFPKVRNAVAEALFTVEWSESREKSVQDALRGQDWSLSPKELKPSVEVIKGCMA
ncbi:MAG: hypothetical protein M1838_001753 [Thelocarpon superellum]|nr:MAG: hypothetical protein M1838_001753 [Thelocarpon superellum]